MDLEAILTLLEDHLVNRRRAEVLTWKVSVLPAAASLDKYVWPKDNEMARLIFFVSRS